MSTPEQNYTGVIARETSPELPPYYWALDLETWTPENDHDPCRFTEHVRQIANGHARTRHAAERRLLAASRAAGLAPARQTSPGRFEFTPAAETAR